MANEVTESTLRSNGFKSIFTILNTNKISGSSMYVGFPNKDPSFPMYVIHPFRVDPTGLTYGTINDYEFEMELEFWCNAEEDRKEVIDNMKDNIMATITNNISTIQAQNLTITSDWFNDGDVTTVPINDEKYHFGDATIKFKLY